MKTYSREEFSVEENIKVGLTISPYIHQRLRIWGMIHGKSPTAYAAQIISTTVEANFENINKQLEDYARARGLTVEQVLASLEADKD